MRPYRAKSMVDIRHGSFNWPKQNTSTGHAWAISKAQWAAQARPIYKLLPMKLNYYFHVDMKANLVLVLVTCHLSLGLHLQTQLLPF
jgi:hypothetical protein